MNSIYAIRMSNEAHFGKHVHIWKKKILVIRISPTTHVCMYLHLHKHVVSVYVNRFQSLLPVCTYQSTNLSTDLLALQYLRFGKMISSAFYTRYRRRRDY